MQQAKTEKGPLGSFSMEKIKGGNKGAGEGNEKRKVHEIPSRQYALRGD